MGLSLIWSHAFSKHYWVSVCMMGGVMTLGNFNTAEASNQGASPSIMSLLCPS